jgi:hypothetical protein
MLWIGGALKKQDTIINTFASQTDIPKTILCQLDIDNSNYTYSKNILSSNVESFAFYTFNNGFGFVSDSLGLVYDNISNKYIIKRGSVSDKDMEKGKAYLQILCNDFIKR